MDGEIEEAGQRRRQRGGRREEIMSQRGRERQRRKARAANILSFHIDLLQQAHLTYNIIDDKLDQLSHTYCIPDRGISQSECTVEKGQTTC